MDPQATSQIEAKLTERQLQFLDTQLMQAIERQETLLIGLALALRDEFRAERKALHERLQADQRSSGERPGYCPVQLFARYIDRSGTLQIYWQMVHRNRRTGGPIYRHIKKGRQDGYPMRSLLAKAGYAADLITEYESRAARIRFHWRELMAIKHTVWVALKRLPMPPGKDTERGTAEVTSSCRLIPRGHVYADHVFDTR